MCDARSKRAQATLVPWTGLTTMPAVCDKGVAGCPPPILRMPMLIPGRCSLLPNRRPVRLCQLFFPDQRGPQFSFASVPLRRHLAAGERSRAHVFCWPKMTMPAAAQWTQGACRVLPYRTPGQPRTSDEKPRPSLPITTPCRCVSHTHIPITWT